MGIMDSVKNKLKENHEKFLDKMEQDKQRKKEMDEQGIPYCPKCLSTSLRDDKKGGSIIKGLVGGAIVGPVGLLAGGIGRNKIVLNCLKCGHKFRA